LGAELFDRDDFREAAGLTWEDPEWVLYRLKKNCNLPIFHSSNGKSSVQESRSFQSGGFYISRSEHGHAIVSANPVGMAGCGNHKHNDVLSFDLFTKGRPIIIDPGSYVYTADFEARNKFRSTAYHNTVQVEGLEINQIDPEELFRMKEQAYPKVLLWKSSGAYDLFEGLHHGFSEQGIIHRRRIYFDKGSPVWIIRDWLEFTRISPTAHTFLLRYHLSDSKVKEAPDFPVPSGVLGCLEQMGDPPPVLNSPPLVLSLGSGKNAVHLALLDPEGATMRMEEGWLAPRYAVRRRAPIAVFTKQGTCPVEFLTAIWAEP
jgi:hypothetical protein